MNQLIQQLITGLSIGGIYALLAVGYSLIYSIFNFTNFSFGAIMMTSAFAGYFAISKLGLPPVGGVLFALLFGACISLLVEFIAYRPMRKKKAPRLFIMISAYGINMFIINLTLVLLGANLREFPISIGQTAFLVGNISIGKIDIIALIVSLISLLVLWIFLEKTTAGIAIRACSQDSSTAGLMGINGNKVSTMVFAISGVTAAVAGIFFGIKYTVYPNLGDLATKAFIASVIGGLGSLPGAITGGILLGVLETMVSGYISSTYRDLFAYGFMVVMLLFLPNGLMGKTSQDKL
jgi:hypothetical protein